MNRNEIYIYQEVHVLLNQDIPRQSLCSCVKSWSKYNVTFNRWTKRNNRGIFQYNRTGNQYLPRMARSLSRPNSAAVFGRFRPYRGCGFCPTAANLRKTKWRRMRFRRVLMHQYFRAVLYITAKISEISTCFSL